MQIANPYGDAGCKPDGLVNAKVERREALFLVRCGATQPSVVEDLCRGSPQLPRELQVTASPRGGVESKGRNSLSTIVQRLNPKLKGFYGYFKHASRTSLAEMDGWIRDRLRSILRKRRTYGKKPKKRPSTLAQPLLYQARALQPEKSLEIINLRKAVANKLESRMREIRQSGSEGGAAPSNALSHILGREVTLLAFVAK